MLSGQLFQKAKIHTDHDDLNHGIIGPKGSFNDAKSMILNVMYCRSFYLDKDMYKP